jgi:nucleoside-diphosphate-sugar epimerase
MTRAMSLARTIIVGAGYAGARLAVRLRGTDAPAPTLTTGSATRAATLGEAGFDVRRWDLDAGAPCPLHAAEVVDATLHYHVPPTPRGLDDARIAVALAALPAVPSRVVYLSTTGVYGDAGGAAVDEDTPPLPHADRSRRRLAAETRLRDWCATRAAEWTILRVPGIYGPWRLPRERLLRGDPVLLEAEAGPGNRIHVDDLVTACVLAGAHPRAANRIFNLGDGDGSSSTRYFTRVAELLGLPPPESLPRAEVQRLVSGEAWSFLGPSRRIDTARIRRELGFTPRYASLDDGLRASIFEERGG